MKKFFVFFVFLFLTTVYADEISMVFSRTTPPYVIEKDSNGIVVDIVREALAKRGHNLKPVFVNIARGVEMFKNGEADANSLLQEGTDVKGHYSDVFAIYQNRVFALKSSNINLQKIDEIAKHSSIGFQNAHSYLGPKYAEVVKKAGNRYKELADQKTQVYMLFMGRTELATMDENIFAYYTNLLEHEKKIKPDIEVVNFNFFEPTKYQVAFRYKKHRDDFNAGLAQIRKSGEYAKIYERYGKKYFEVKR